MSSKPASDVHSFKPFTIFDSNENAKQCTCIYTNCDSYLNKRAEFQAVLDLHEPALIAMTEIKPKHSRYGVQECEIALDGYDLFHNLEKEGRGVALFAKKTLKASLCEHLVSNFEESIFVECQSGGEKLRVGVIYRSPSSGMINNNKLNDLISEATSDNPDNLLILGDFNFKEIDWPNGRANTLPGHPAYKFLSTCKNVFLIQNQTEPTRYRDGQEPSLLDLVLTNRDDIINEISTVAGLGKSDHVMLIININWTCKQSKSELLNYSKADFDSIIKFLDETDWDKELKGLDTNEIWLKIKERINLCVDEYVPIRQVNQRNKKWMDKGTLETVRKKHRLWRLWKRTRKTADRQKYLRANNQANKACKKAQKRLEKAVAEKAKTDPKAFWSYVSNKTKTRSGIADLKKPDGTRTTTDQEKADILNSFFQSVFTKEDNDDLPDPPAYIFEDKLAHFDIPEEKVKKLLSELHPGKAAGPDGLHPMLLSKAADVLAHPFTLLFRTSLKEGKIPEDWRKAKVCPIFKKGSKLVANNYRPVSLTSIVCKTMEKLVREQLVKHLENNNLVNDNQHGFVQGRSCTTQLLDVMDAWTKIIDDGGAVDIIYMDFQKAFDSVPHRRLLTKVKAHGISDEVLAWITDFLSSRTQTVVVNSAESKEAPVTSGIPQGSVLGPLLFVLYINDLPSVVMNPIRLFADDTKIFTRSEIDGATDSLQDDLTSLQDWSTKWCLRFHPEKCHVVKLGNRKSEALYTMTGTNVAGEEIDIILTESEVEKDLGVNIDNKLCFKQHVSQATSKANRVLGIIRRSFGHLTEKTFVQLFKALVRPILEYGHTVWQPFLKTLCQDLEDVQRRATNLLSTLKNKSYPERLAALHLPSLEHRRKRGDMIDVYKYIHGIYKTNSPNFSLNTNQTRSNTIKLAKAHLSTRIRQNYFTERVANTWNSLPENVVSAPNVNTFKARLDSFWSKLPTVYDPDCYSTL